MIQGINHDCHARQRFRMFNVFVVCRKLMYSSRLPPARSKFHCSTGILQVALGFSIPSKVTKINLDIKYEVSHCD